MKKALTILAISMIASATLVASASAGNLWSMVKNSGLEKRETKAITLEVQGVNLRAYIFDVPEMKSMCINVWGEDVQQLECKTYAEIHNLPQPVSESGSNE